MKALIVYDSEFGNTKQIAEAIAAGIENCTADVMHVGEINPGNLDGVGLLVVGSPTRAFRPTNGIVRFLDSLSDGVINDIAVAAFDTRIASEDIKRKFFRFIVDSGGYAANPIAEKLRKKGGILVLPPEGFFVEGEKGPLKDGETARAKAWAKLVCHA
ncbi:MAG: flavodoxin family protein [Bacteroidales bacterium]|jgi:flavodoxin|nr:flavodoxin family protein [Bacteroidales bacterium]